MIYQDDYKYIDNYVEWVGDGLELNRVNRKTINLTFDPSSMVKINGVLYQIPVSGEIKYVIDANYPIVKFDFINSDSSFLADVELNLR